MVFEFHKLEYHEKLDFTKLEYQKSDRFLHISETVVDCNIVCKKMLFGYFHRHYTKILRPSTMLLSSINSSMPCFSYLSLAGKDLSFTLTGLCSFEWWRHSKYLSFL